MSVGMNRSASRVGVVQNVRNLNGISVNVLSLLSLLFVVGNVLLVEVVVG